MNTAYNNCQCCGRKTPIFYADIEAYTGLLVGFIRRVNSGYFCADCAQNLSDDAIRKTLSVGLFSIWALYYVPAVLINHGVIKSRIEKLNRIVNLRAKCTSNLRVKVYHLWDVKHHQSGTTSINNLATRAGLV